MADQFQIQANDRKRQKDERELAHRYKVFAKLQTPFDYEALIEGLICRSPPSGDISDPVQS